MTETKIKVAVRSRPLLHNESAASEPLEFCEGTIVKTATKSFIYNFAFKPDVTNGEVYDAAVADNIHHLFDGYNVTILAYGSTGSGKTYTMGLDYNPNKNSTQDLGIIPRSIGEIFRLIESRKETKDCSVGVTFIEIYKEEVFDLLSPVKGKICHVREDSDGKFQVPELIKLQVESVKEAFQILTERSEKRHTSATAKNAKSSRSHAIFSVYVDSTDKSTNKCKRGKFQLVDLAGSERVASSKTDNTKLLKEGININLGLLTLRKVITGLRKKDSHIPYRDSNLTKLLQDSFGGCSYTLMIACINPSSTSKEDSLSTLRYASSAGKVKNRPAVNLDTPAGQIENLKKQVKHLQDTLDQQKSTTLPADSPLLQSAYSRIEELNRKLRELEEKNRNIKENMDSLYKEIQIIVSELTIEVAGSHPWLKTYLEKLQLIQSSCVQIIVQLDVDNSVELVEDISDNNTAECDDSCKSISTSELELDMDNFSDNYAVSEISEEYFQSYKAYAEKQNSDLQNVQRNLDSKMDMVRVVRNVLQSVADDEEQAGEVEKQLQILIKEKNDLQETLGKTEKFSKDMVEKVEKYEAQIQSLEDQLRKNTKCMQLKKESQAKMDVLQKEIQVLKKYKVQIMKQMKENANKHMQVQRQKDKDIAKLERESRKKDLENTKMKVKFSNQIRVLQSKVDQAAASKTRLLQSLQKKKSGKSEIRAKQSKESLLEWIEEEMKVVVDNGRVKIEIEVLESLAETLKESIRKLKERADEAKEPPSEVDKLNNDLHDVLGQIKNITKQNVEDRTAKSGIILDGITELQEAKHIIEFLFNKAISAQLETTKQIHHFDAKLRKEESVTETLEDQLKKVEADNKALSAELEAAKQLQIVSDSATEELQLDRTSQGETSAPKSNTIIQDSPSTDEELQNLRNLFKNKCEEIDKLKQELSNLKKGKNKVQWLSDLSNFPETTTEFQSSKRSLEESMFTDPEEDENKSMMEEYLCDESFNYDKNDPDWRLTPLCKQAKRGRFERSQPASKNDGSGTSGIDVIMHSSQSETESLKTYCDCAGLCKTMRCGCKKRQVHCSISCTCDRANCLNMETEVAEDSPY